jgi:transposase
MGYRELHRMEIEEVVRRWQVKESQRAIARATGLARETVKKYVAAAISLGLSATGPPPTELQLLELRRLGVVAVQPVIRVAPQLAMLEPYRQQIATWLDQDQLLLTRIQELLDSQHRVQVKYTTLRRYVRQAGLWKQPRSTVRMAPTAPGEVAEMDFGKLGTLINPSTGKRQVVYGLLVVLVYSRYAFLWPLVQQTVEATIEGLEKTWAFFQGLPVRLILDNFPAAVAGPDALNPRPTRAFLEYSQARGLLLDPARVRAPRDKPHVESGIRFSRERWWKGGRFLDLVDSRQQAEGWCRDVAGMRVHGTTRRVPRVVFEDQERPHLQPYDGVPYDVPLWSEVKVHPDHHVSVQYALYSAPSTTCPPGTKLEARCDTKLVKLYRAGELVKVHPRKPKGGRSTDYADYPPERTAYAMRAPDHVIRQAKTLGPNVGHFAERLLEGTFPWSKLRQGQKLLRLADRYAAERLDAACARALGFDLLEVRRVERILVLALEHEGQPTPAPEQRVQPLPAGRFARPGSAFDHRYLPAVATVVPVGEEPS